MEGDKMAQKERKTKSEGGERRPVGEGSPTLHLRPKPRKKECKKVQIEG